MFLVDKSAHIKMLTPYEGFANAPRRVHKDGTPNSQRLHAEFTKIARRIHKDGTPSLLT